MILVRLGSQESLVHTFELDVDPGTVPVAFALTATTEPAPEGAWVEGTIDHHAETSDGRWVVRAVTPDIGGPDGLPGEAGWWFLQRDVDGVRDVIDTVLIA